MDGLAGKYVLHHLKAAMSFMMPDLEVIAHAGEETGLRELERGHGALQKLLGGSVCQLFELGKRVGKKMLGSSSVAVLLR